ncbi:MAG: 16S rRNA (uracil(1498)-N(3))-methyltransferase [Oscillospiraceae bacterium]|nr:16S rRNA (uracil(1498)-N(3))-methyltransferase [Oscillospiraceae bacterium]
MPKFFTARENITDTEIVIESEDAKHIQKVLRLGVGDEITICDGRGIDYTAVISEIEKTRVVCGIKDSRVCDTEPSINVTLYQGLPKAAKMDYIIQKTTELGITKIVPAKLSRCVVKLDGEAAERKKVERWQKIAGEAAKQSGRGVIPEVCMPMGLDDIIAELKNVDMAFAPYECEQETRLKDILDSAGEVKNVSFIIGPEGGFDITEIEKLKAAGIKTITLGRRILRTETAGEAVLAMTMYGLNEV